MPNTRCATIVSTRCSTSPASRPSVKQAANRLTSPITRSGRAEQQLREEIERAAGDTWGEIVEQQREWARERDRVQGLELEP
jgi:hypothetical protein